MTRYDWTPQIWHVSKNVILTRTIFFKNVKLKLLDINEASREIGLPQHNLRFNSTVTLNQPLDKTTLINKISEELKRYVQISFIQRVKKLTDPFFQPKSAWKNIWIRRGNFFAINWLQVARARTKQDQNVVAIRGNLCLVFTSSVVLMRLILFSRTRI